MNKIMVLAAGLMMSSLAEAQQVRQWWLDMPDSLVEYMNKSKRIEAMDYVDMGLKIDVTNHLDGNTTVDTLTSDFLEVKLSEAAQLQMKVLPMDSDSVVCVVKTFMGPEAESVATIYDRGWNQLSRVEWSRDVNGYVQKPDSMSDERFEQLKRQFEPILVQASLSLADDSLTLSLSMPLLVNMKKEELMPIIKQRKLKWKNGKFIEC
jgi:hypothetical protein